MDWKEWHRVLSDILECEYLERSVTLEKARELKHLCNQYESQCIPRTADMPEDAVGWERYPVGVAMQGGFQCQWIRRKGRVDPAPDLLPGEPGPVYRHIVDVE